MSEIVFETTADIEGGLTMEIEVRRRDYPSRSGRSRGSYREYNADPRMYVGVAGETILENLMLRRQRPYREYKRMILPVFNKVAPWQITQMGWRQKAGCACGCSPAFVITNYNYNAVMTTNDKHLHCCDIFITLKQKVEEPAPGESLTTDQFEDRIKFMEVA